MRSLIFAAILAALNAVPSVSQIIADDNADLSVAAPAFAAGNGPVIAVDSGHHNYHTIRGRYAPFGALLRNDGFRVIDSAAEFTAENLSKSNVLVIANAEPADDAKPQASAFRPDEISAVKAWVSDGGSLLLIADHRPFAGSARDLAIAFGFAFDDGVVERDPMNDGRLDIFRTADGSWRDDVVTRGRNPMEAVCALRTFTGTAFLAPPQARPIIVLPRGYMAHDCGLPCPAGVPEHDASGYFQGAIMTFGKGRIAVFGEAAMFSTQIIPAFNPPFKFGFNEPGSEQNNQFVLNLMHWLAGVLPP